VSALTLLTPCPCVKLSPLPLSGCRLFPLGCEFPPSLSFLPATLTKNLQLTENKATLGLFRATLTSRVKHKSFVCHSYKKQGG